MAMTGCRLELRPEWKRLASKEMDAKAIDGLHDAFTV